MKCFEVELNGETIRLRLTSNNVCEIEKKNNKSIIEIMQDISQTNVVNMLMYMRRFEIPNYSLKEANELYDKFIDNDYSMQDVVFDVVYEALVVSGIMLKKELDHLRKVVGIQEEMTQEKIEDLQKR